MAKLKSPTSIGGHNIVPGGASVDDVLAWNGAAYVPVAPSGFGITAGLPVLNSTWTYKVLAPPPTSGQIRADSGSLYLHNEDIAATDWATEIGLLSTPSSLMLRGPSGIDVYTVDTITDQATYQDLTVTQESSTGTISDGDVVTLIWLPEGVGGGGDFLPLAGGLMTGRIDFDNSFANRGGHIYAYDITGREVLIVEGGDGLNSEARWLLHGAGDPTYPNHIVGQANYYILNEVASGTMLTLNNTSGDDAFGWRGGSTVTSPHISVMGDAYPGFAILDSSGNRQFVIEQINGTAETAMITYTTAGASGFTLVHLFHNSQINPYSLSRHGVVIDGMLYINSAEDASVGTDGDAPLVIGQPGGQQLRIDNNEILSASGISAQILYIQNEGGETRFNGLVNAQSNYMQAARFQINGDTDTYIYGFAANELGFVASGRTAMRISSPGANLSRWWFSGESNDWFEYNNSTEELELVINSSVSMRWMQQSDRIAEIPDSQGQNHVVWTNNPYTNGTGDYQAYWDNDMNGTNVGWAVTTTLSSGAAIKKNIVDYDEDTVGAAFLRIPMKSWEYDAAALAALDPRNPDLDGSMKKEGEGPTRHWYVAEDVEAELPWLVGQPDGDPVKRIKDGRPWQVAVHAALRHLDRRLAALEAA